MSTYVPHVGFVQFPRGPRDLSSEVCPACLVDRAGSACANCGLDLASPLIATLDSSSRDAAAALEARLEFIGRIRFDSAAVGAQRRAETSVDLAGMTPPAVVPTVQRAAPVPVAPPAAPTAAPTAALTAEPVAPPVVPARRHIGVQVILLIAGVSLLSIGAIFFLVYAFITFGLIWRTVIILAVTVAAIAGASILRKRKLRITAEGIAALAVVFVFLDVYAVRANDFFDLGSANGQLYWGVALLVSAIGFGAWHRGSGLRLPGVVASVVFAPAVGLITAGALDGAEESWRAFAGLGALALGGLAHPLFRFRVEKSIVAGFGVVGLTLAAVTSPFLVAADGYATEWMPAVGFGIVAALALAHAALVARRGNPVTPGRVAAVVGAASLASATLFMAVRVDEPGFAVFWPVVVSAIVALGLEMLARGLTAGLPRHLARIAAVTAGVIVMLVLLIPVIYAFVPTAELVSAVSPRWTVGGASRISIQPENAAAILALLVVVVLVGAAWTIAGTLETRLLAVQCAAFGTLIIAVPLVGVLWAAVAAWLLIAGAGLAALRMATTRGWSAGLRIAIVVASIVSMTLAYLSSWASIDTWWYGSVGVIAILVAARAATARVAIRASTLGVAAVLAFVAAGAEGIHINERFVEGADPVLEASLTVAILAVVLLAASAALSRRLSTTENRVLFWLSMTAASGTGAILWIAGASQQRFSGVALPYRLTTVLVSVGFVVAVAMWATVASTAVMRAERVVASVAIAPAAAWALDSLAKATSLPAFATSIAPIAAALLVSAAALTLALRGRGLRVALETGAAIVAIVGVLMAIPSDATWLALVLAAVAALMVAISRDGLFASTHRRRHVGWLALLLAVSALWWALGETRQDAVELFVLPLAGALLIIATFEWRAASRADRSATAAPYIALAALLVALVPIAVVAATGPTVRTIVIVASCATMLIVASLATRTGALRPYLDSAAAASSAGLLIAGFGRPVVIATVPRRDDIQVDVWAATTFAIIVAAVIIQCRVADPSTRRRRVEAAEVLLSVAVVGIVVIEVFVIEATGLGTLRAAVLLVLLAGVYIGAQFVNRAPFTIIIGWIALAAAAVVAIAATGLGAIDPFEWATGVIALALLSVGSVRLSRSAGLRSWPWLAPGIIVLLLPSLVATYTDAPIWRLVGLGVACVILIVIGALAGLQAPLVIGSVVVVVHAIRTFAPQIVAVYQLTEWWVWAVVGGGIILFVAVTLEKRVRDLNTIGHRISALR